MELFIIILLIAIIIYIGFKNYQFQQECGSLKEIKLQISETDHSLKQKQTAQELYIQNLSSLEQQQINSQNKIISLQQQAAKLKETIQQNQEVLKNYDDIFANYEQQYEMIKKNQEERCSRIIEETTHQIEDIEENCKLTIQQKENETKIALKSFSLALENERSKYLSILETIQNAQNETEKDFNRHIKILDDTKEDISYLLNNVANKLSNPDILYKLIWSEYIQKPVNEMLDYILPSRDCAGIYKITNDSNKKSYIGRSTSVRKRLIDHIKSAVGISTIANQHIHKVMREEGLWNFTFELIEECEKDQLNEREKYYINFFSTEKLGYNQKAGG